MKILEGKFQENGAQLSLWENGESLWRKDFSYSHYEEGFQRAVSLLLKEKLAFDGGTLLFCETGFFFHRGCFVKPNGSYESIVNYFSEKLNVPFLFGVPLSAPDFHKQLKAAEERAAWVLEYYDFHPGKEEYSIESLLTTGNGYMGLRGTLPEMEISSACYPATYLAGVYDRADSQVGSRLVSNEDLVNAPNFQYFSLAIGDGEPMRLTKERIRFLSRRLHLKNGLFESTMEWEDEEGNRIEVQTKRFVSMENPHVYYMHYQLKPLNFSGPVTLYSKADGGVYNYNVERYRSLNRNHLEVVQRKAEGSSLFLLAQTKESKINIWQTAQLKVDPSLWDVPVVSLEKEDSLLQRLSFFAIQNKAYSFEKKVRIEVYREGQKIQNPPEEAPFPDFKGALQQSEVHWQKAWKEAEVRVTGDLFSQKLLHLHAYHLMVSASPRGSQGLDVSVTARGLHGEGYRGHIFWDEQFIFPFFMLHFPTLSRQLLCYRLKRLGAAKENAQQNGYPGAMYPWQSGQSGKEETQEMHLNPLTGVWGEDHSRLQRHVSLSVAYNIWNYYTLTGDVSLLKEGGAKTYLEIATFWVGAAAYSKEDGRYHIAGVMGPDEFHESLPGSPNPGVKDNAYTNIMVVWLLEELPRILSPFSQEEQRALLGEVGMEGQVQKKCLEMQKKLALSISKEGIIAQFDGYLQLKEIDWAHYRQKYGNIYRMDRILLAEGESADAYQVSKQADLMMAFYNLPSNRVGEMVNHLGYVLPPGFEKKNDAYYLARTSHGSTLSRVVYAATGQQFGKSSDSWRLYQEALASDYNDMQGGTTAEGIHTGVMAATLDDALFVYGGLSFLGGMPALHPALPKAWKSLAFSFFFLSVRYQVLLEKGKAIIEASENADLLVEGQKIHLLKEAPQTVSWKGETK